MSLEVPGNTPDPAATPLTLHFSDDAERRDQARAECSSTTTPRRWSRPSISVPNTHHRNRHARAHRSLHLGAGGRGDIGWRPRDAQRLGQSERRMLRASDGLHRMAVRSDRSNCGRPRTTNRILVSIRHPNSSGFQIDPRTGDEIPAHYISHILIKAGGSALLEAQTGISVSENPTLGVASDQSLALPVTVDAVDSVSQAHFTGSTRARELERVSGPGPLCDEWRRALTAGGPRRRLRPGSSRWCCWPPRSARGGGCRTKSASSTRRVQSHRAAARRVCPSWEQSSARCARS